jgi:hypothetical protein
MPTPFAYDVRGYMRALDSRLCGLCGNNLDYWIFFIGREGQADNRYFKGPAHHQECAKYAVLTLSTSHPEGIWLYRTRKYVMRTDPTSREKVACYVDPIKGSEQIS